MTFDLSGRVILQDAFSTVLDHLTGKSREAGARLFDRDGRADGCRHDPGKGADSRARPGSRPAQAQSAVAAGPTVSRCSTCLSISRLRLRCGRCRVTWMASPARCAARRPRWSFSARSRSSPARPLRSFVQRTPFLASSVSGRRLKHKPASSRTWAGRIRSILRRSWPACAPPAWVRWTRPPS